MMTEPEGILILDKPAGITSHDCVAKVRRLYHTKKVGHTGTLDPMATGVLPILLGRAAKAAEYLVSENKHYLAVLRLGLTTDTEDVTGTALSVCPPEDIPDEAAVQAVLERFRGSILQVPPMYSALKVNGEKLCDLARRGVTVEREARPVEIFRLTAEKINDTDYALDVFCSKGTYIRTLCADIGAALGCGGVMASLRRAGTGNYTLDGAHTLEELETLTDEERLTLLAPTETLFSDCPALRLDGFFLHLADSGQPVFLHKLSRTPEFAAQYPEGAFVRLTSAEKGFFALGEVQNVTDDTGTARLAVRPVKRFVL